ncbi:hypothetical protein, partial [Klebsiella pneumoniae]|uniref:hypothetical protein n=1 Tax=Klebsiella pneumoniae TaxID=573 RepID=UPI0019D6C866
FSGETHKMINGVDTNGYYTSLPQVDIDAGLNARFRDFYNNGSSPGNIRRTIQANICRRSISLPARARHS